MKLISSDYFSYRNNELYCEEVPVKTIIKKTGTPVYIYSSSFFRDRYNEFHSSFRPVDHKIFYAVKSNGNLSVINTFLSQGSGIDVNSEGELFRGLKAGADPRDIILTGVGKTDQEIRQGLEKDLLLIKAESEEEVYVINRIAAEMGKVARVAIRFNPDVNPQTHPYISTGLAENKFGMDKDNAERIFRMKRELDSIVFTGIDMHIGSQITSVEPFLEAVKKMSDFYFYLREKGINLEHFDIGGGMGVQYNNEEIFTIPQLAQVLLPELQRLNCKILFEPGRYLTANGGVLVSRVLYTKCNQVKHFLITDAAVNDLMRPSFYGAYHHIQPVELKNGRKDITADVVGPVCETGDFLAKNRNISKIEREEYLAVLSAGSYGMVMSSNYNARRRGAEVLVDGKEFKLIRSRESFDHLIFDEELLLRNNEA
jgi:diaminopimelate decarboxylase